MMSASQVHGVGETSAAEYLAGWQRERAEFDNFRKRVASEHQQREMRLKAQALSTLLAVADTFQVMAKHVPQDLQNHSWAQGVLHVARQMEQLLEQQGIAPIIETGVPFNPSLHEAIAQVKDKKIKSGLVLEIIQPGYKLGDNVLKPARVKVSA